MSAQSFCLSCTRVHECFSSENYGADNTKLKRVISKRDGIRSGNPSPSPHQFDVCRASHPYTCLQYSVLDPKLRNSAVPLIGSLSCSDKAKINKGDISFTHHLANINMLPMILCEITRKDIRPSIHRLYASFF